MMIKKLIPAAALLALTGAAQAQVSIYGLVDVAMAKSLADDASTPKKDGTLIFGGNSATRVGLKGSTDLGSGIKGNFQLETSAIDINGKLDGDILFGRQAWVGASGAFGEVRAGRQDSVGFQTLIGFDLNGAANIASASVAAGIAGGLLNGQGTRSVQYIAPTVAGFKVQLGYQAADTSGITTEADAGGKASTAYGVTYTLDKLTLAVAGSSKTSSGGNSASSFAGSYDFGIFKAVANISGTKGAKGSMIGAVAPVAGVNVGLQYAKNTDTKVNATELFVNKEILKNTYAYADYVSKKAGSVKNDAYAVGVIYTF
jgi:predicted porin